MSEEELKKGLLNSSIPSAAYDKSCTSHAGIPGDLFIQTDTPSTKVFTLSDNYPIPGSNVVKTHHNVRKPARTVDMVPSLTKNSVLSGGKFAQAGYVSVCDNKEVNLYDVRAVKITVYEETVLKGCRCPSEKLWLILLVKCATTKKNTQNLLLNKTSQPQSGRYVVPTTAKIRERSICSPIRPPTQSTTSTNCQALNVQSSTSIEPRSFQPIHHG